MRCKTVLERLDDHVDGILAATESEAIRNHLDGCKECRETGLAVNAASASLSAWNDIDPPADGFQQILARLETLPLEAFERPVHAVAPRNRIAQFLPWFETPRAERIRWMSTSGLAAAAAVLAAVLIARTEPRPVRRLRAEPMPSVMNAEASWFHGSDFDNGLLYLSNGRPAAQPARTTPRYGELQGSTR